MVRSLSVAVVVLVLGAALGFGPEPGRVEADGSRCFPLIGVFDAVPVALPECASPVGFCTAGDLSGSLNGTYAFTMESSTPADPRVPGINNFAGESVVTTRRGATLTGIDTGTIDLDPARFGNFVSLITFTTGTGYLEGATGQIALRGKLNFASGMTEGNYRGQLCF